MRWPSEEEGMEVVIAVYTANDNLLRKANLDFL